MNGSYLENIKITNFGAFSDKIVGPFTPHFNVVFGRNESGKTTLSSFVGGVLFGWEDARGSRNTYKPVNADRAGSLFFSTPNGEEELSRIRNAEGLQGNESLVSDIDKETFRTMFSLNGDELRSLRNTTDITAKLLTAGSGTGASPAHAVALVQKKLAEYVSRASGVEYSLFNLSAQQDDLRDRVAQAADITERFKRQDREFKELEPQRDELLKRIDTLNGVVETLKAQCAVLEKLDSELEELEGQIAELRNDERDLKAESRLHHKEISADLLHLTDAADRELRDRIDALAADEAKYEHAVDLAQDNFTTSKAAYEALVEAEDSLVVKKDLYRQRGVQIILSIGLPLIFMATGVPLFVYGRNIARLSFTVGGIGLVVIAIVLAFAALVVLFRLGKKADANEAYIQDAHWVMLQDKKKLETCIRNRESFRVHMQEQLNASGLAAAQGFLGRARTLLDDARDERAKNALYQQRLQAVVARRAALENKAASLRNQRQNLFNQLDFHIDHNVEALNALLVAKSQQRAGLMETSERLNRRYGELKQELSHAMNERDFDMLKLQYEQVRTRINESAWEYARLLLAKHMLQAAIAAWESNSQPEVYRQAGRLISLMTNGRWVKVAMSDDGRLQVTNAVKTVYEPNHLSLGTCQQLYLALRIALLMTADNVGRAIPILADDILVNFDSERRLGAAQALAELAKVRQVILFTCHEEIVETMRSADSALNEIVL